MSFRGQMGIMEYIFLTFLIMVVIVVLMFFFTGWQVSQLQMEQTRTRVDAALTAAKKTLNTPFMAKDDSLFDDVKLTSLLDMECSELEGIFGRRWFAEVCTGDCFDCTGDCIQCQGGMYDPDCNYWSYCKKEGEFDAYVFPVNIQRKLSQVSERGILGQTDLGTLKVGIYYELE